VAVCVLLELHHPLHCVAVDAPRRHAGTECRGDTGGRHWGGGLPADHDVELVLVDEQRHERAGGVAVKGVGDGEGYRLIGGASRRAQPPDRSSTRCSRIATWSRLRPRSMCRVRGGSLSRCGSASVSRWLWRSVPPRTGVAGPDHVSNSLPSWGSHVLPLQDHAVSMPWDVNEA
jgi:hypothetical protein